MISNLWESPEYFRNLAAIKAAFPGAKVLTLKDMKTYLGVKDNRTLKGRYHITGRVTVETFAMRLSR